MSTPSDNPLMQVNLSEWSAIEIQKAFHEKPLLLQVKRVVNDKTKRPRRVIVFVHGLNSDAMTWMTFLNQAFQAPELQSCDFALFNFQTSLFSRLIPFQRLPRVEDWARVLSNVIQNTLIKHEKYDSFVLVGHSMGGIVSKLAIRYLWETDKADAKRIHSLFTYGTPSYGSDRINFIGSFFSPDLALLKAFNGQLLDLQTFWNSSITSNYVIEDKLTVFERAAISVKDYWVPPLSASGALNSKFILKLASSHSELIKPLNANDPRIRWFIMGLKEIQKESECTLIEIKNGATTDIFYGDDSADKLINAFFNALYVLDSGTANGILVDDLFALYYESDEVLDKEGNVLDRIPGPMNLMKAIEVKENVTYCKLKSLSYERALEDLHKAIDELGQVEYVEQEQINKIFGSIFGIRATKVPRLESITANAMEDIYAKYVDQTKNSPLANTLLSDLLLAGRKFQNLYPTSLLADRALWHEAWASQKLGRYEEAINLYENFCDKYPFSISVKGARNHIKEIQYRIRLRDSNNSPEVQLEFAEYLLQSENDDKIEEASTLAFEAYKQMPNLIKKMKFSSRFFLCAKYVCFRLINMNLEDPQKIQDFLTQYNSDFLFRDQTSKSIKEKTSESEANLLLTLLDSTHDNWNK